MTHKKESGFTLIEIVMVLVLLGILAAVAAPKYFDLQKEAQVKAAQAIVAEVQARVNGAFAQSLLDGKACSDAVVDAKAEVVGDNKIKSTQFTVSVADNTSDLTVTVYPATDSKKTNILQADDAKVLLPVCK